MTNKQIKKANCEINLKHQHTDGPLLNYISGSQYYIIYLPIFVIKTKREVYRFVCIDTK